MATVIFSYFYILSFTVCALDFAYKGINTTAAIIMAITPGLNLLRAIRVLYELKNYRLW